MTFPRFVYAADLDGDDNKDVLSVSQGDTKVAWYVNNGDKTFGAQNIIENTYTTGFPFTVHADDLDSDGDIDVLVGWTGSSDRKLVWYENLGGGTFSDAKVLATGHTGDSSIDTGDLDGDGDTDILFGHGALSEWYENLGGGTFTSHAIYTAGVSGGASDVSLADFDSDDDLDVLMVSSKDGAGWIENLGAGTFSDIKIIASNNDYAAAKYAGSANAADLNNDGHVDVFIGGFKYFAWYENDGEGSFSGPNNLNDASEYWAGARASFISDFNGDGLLDALTVPHDGVELHKNTIAVVSFTYGPSTEGTGQGFQKANNYPQINKKYLYRHSTRNESVWTLRLCGCKRMSSGMHSG